MIMSVSTFAIGLPFSSKGAAVPVRVVNAFMQALLARCMRNEQGRHVQRSVPNGKHAAPGFPSRPDFGEIQPDDLSGVDAQLPDLSLSRSARIYGPDHPDLYLP